MRVAFLVARAIAMPMIMAMSNAAPPELPELSPFEVEALRVSAYAQDSSEYGRFSSRTANTRLGEAYERLWGRGLVDASWDITDAGRAVLAAYGVA